MTRRTKLPARDMSSESTEEKVVVGKEDVGSLTEVLGKEVQPEPTPEPEPPPAPKGILEEHFTTNLWKGFTNYNCREEHCVWSGIDEVRAKDHWIDRHMRPVQSSPEGSKLYDRYGNKN